MMTLLTTGILSLAFLVPGTKPWLEHQNQKVEASLSRLSERIQMTLEHIAKLRAEAERSNQDGKLDLFLKQLDEEEQFFRGMLGQFRAVPRMRLEKP
jgi:hypothetical protein